MKLNLPDVPLSSRSHQEETPAVNDIDVLLGKAYRAVIENCWGDAQMLIANIQYQRSLAPSGEPGGATTELDADALCKALNLAGLLLHNKGDAERGHTGAENYLIAKEQLRALATALPSLIDAGRERDELQAKADSAHLTHLHRYGRMIAALGVDLGSVDFTIDELISRLTQAQSRIAELEAALEQKTGEAERQYDENVNQIAERGKLELAWNRAVKAVEEIPTETDADSWLDADDTRPLIPRFAVLAILTAEKPE